MRPADLAREHGISTQAVRNYEQDGYLPPAERTGSGYRVYTELHAAALRAYLALIRAYGYAASNEIMTALNADRLDDALLVVHRGHRQLLRDRATLDAVREAVDHLTGTASSDERPAPAEPWTIGDLARRLGVTPATLRKWESVGIVSPARDPATRYRVYGASDIRDAELAHLLRRGGYQLEHIATVVDQIRTAGGTSALASALEGWQRKLTEQGEAMLRAAARVSAYLDARRSGG